MTVSRVRSLSNDYNRREFLILTGSAGTPWSFFRHSGMCIRWGLYSCIRFMWLNVHSRWQSCAQHHTRSAFLVFPQLLSALIALGHRSTASSKVFASHRPFLLVWVFYLFEFPRFSLSSSLVDSSEPHGQIASSSSSSLTCSLERQSMYLCFLQWWRQSCRSNRWSSFSSLSFETGGIDTRGIFLVANSRRHSSSWSRVTVRRPPTKICIMMMLSSSIEKLTRAFRHPPQHSDREAQ